MVDYSQMKCKKIEKQTMQVTLTLSEFYQVMTQNNPDQLNELRSRVREVPKVKFKNLSELIEFCNLTVREFSNYSGYNYKTILRWIETNRIPKEIKEELLTITISEAPRIGGGVRTTIRLMGAKGKYEIDGEVYTVYNKTLRLKNSQGKSKIKPFSLDILVNRDPVNEYSFLKEKEFR